MIVTLLPGLYNAVQTYRLTRRTTFIGTVTAERRRRSTQLRDTVGKFCAVAHAVGFLTPAGSPAELERRIELDRLRHLILLFLDPRYDNDRRPSLPRRAPARKAYGLPQLPRWPAPP